MPVLGPRAGVGVLTALVALVTAVASGTGVGDPVAAYPSEQLRRAFAPNDAVTLLIGLPVLTGAVWLARRGRVTGVLLWPGALFFLVYNALVYVFVLPLDWRWGAEFVVVVGGLGAMAAAVARIEAPRVQRGLVGRVPARASGGVLVGLGVLFLLRAVIVLAGAATTGGQVAPAEIGTAVADVLVTPAWMVGGLLLWRHRPSGYALAVGLLCQASMLFVGLMAFLLLQPMLTPVELVPSGVVVVAVLALPCLVPFMMFLRATWALGGQSPDGNSR